MRRRTFAWGAAAGIVVAGCGIAVQRDLSEVKPAAVVFDDMCGLQAYHDAFTVSTVQPPAVVFSRDLERTEGKREAGGRTRFLFDSDFQLETLRRVLNENWRRIPPEIGKAKAIAIEVEWAERAGTKRVVTELDAELAIGPETWPLPYHPCLTELLFGADLYRTRREMLGLPPPKPSLGMQALKPFLAPDGGVTDAASAAARASDGGVSPIPR